MSQDTGGTPSELKLAYHRPVHAQKFCEKYAPQLEMKNTGGESGLKIRGFCAESGKELGW